MTIFKRRHLSAQVPGFKRSTSNTGFKVRRGHAGALHRTGSTLAAGPAVQPRVAVKPTSPLGQALAEQLLSIAAARQQVQQAQQHEHALQPAAVLRMLQLARAQATRNAVKTEQQLLSTSSGCAYGPAADASPAVSAETVTCVAGGDNADCGMEVDSEGDSGAASEGNNIREQPQAEDGKITATLQSLVSVLAHYTQQKGTQLPTEAFKHIASAMLV
jgi:hypothetical protein